LEVIAPGVVPVDDWRPDDDHPPLPAGSHFRVYAGVGRREDTLRSAG
jgi:hypothetical protein